MEIVLIVCLILFVSTVVGLFAQFHDVILAFIDRIGDILQSLPPFFEGFIITAIVMIVISLFIAVLFTNDRLI